MLNATRNEWLSRLASKGTNNLGGAARQQSVIFENANEEDAGTSRATESQKPMRVRTFNNSANFRFSANGFKTLESA